MKNFYSIILFASNQWSNENMAIGLLVVTPKERFFNYSNRKLQVAELLNPEGFKLFKLLFKRFVEKENNKVDFAYMDYLSRYCNGLSNTPNPST